MPSHLFQAYGLTIASELDLPELLPAPAGPPVDLTIRLAKLPRDLPDAPERFEFGSLIQKLDWKAVGKFEIRGVNEIMIDPNPDTSEALLRIPLLGSVMALLLHVRGLFVLHASAVLIDGQGVGFLGDKGAGKSTTAGALISRGYSLVTDDVLACDCDAPITVRPGFPQMKLTPESAEAVQLPNAKPAPKIDFPGFNKQQLTISSHYSVSSPPLKRLYILERASDPAVHPLSITESFQGLMRFSYLIRFGRDALFPDTSARLLKHCSKIASQNLVRRLVVPNSLESLSIATKLIEADLAG